MSATPSTSPLAFSALRRFVRPKSKVETCELCGAALPPEHQHVLELKSRRLACSCDACAILFSGQHSPRYRRVPRRIQNLPDLQITDAQWENLHLPINLAFFYFSTPENRVVAMFPGPAGATESLLTLEAWDELAQANPTLRDLEPDVEALLVNRVAMSREYCRVPIDECFKLVGLIRTHWRGLSGGSEVWGQIALFFDDVKKRSTGVLHA